MDTKVSTGRKRPDGQSGENSDKNREDGEGEPEDGEGEPEEGDQQLPREGSNYSLSEEGKKSEKIENNSETSALLSR